MTTFEPVERMPYTSSMSRSLRQMEPRLLVWPMARVVRAVDADLIAQVDPELAQGVIRIAGRARPRAGHCCHFHKRQATHKWD